jgi:superfamily II DNA/RNA helicase
MKLNHCQFLVVDEADTLCDTVYEQQVASLIKSVLKSKPTGKQSQIAIVGATKTAAVNAFVTSIEGLNLNPTVTEDAHMLVPDLEQVFIPVGRRKRTSCLSEILTTDTPNRAKTIIFTNSVRTCNFVSRFLTESGIEGVNSTSFHGEIPPKIRSANYKKFTNSNSHTNVMVCTNLASRGIDLDTVDHVIMYDFPHTLADYIHRAGRTARAGRLGKVTALYTKRNLELARKIQDATRLGKPIEYKKAITTQRRVIKLEKYKQALSELKHHPSKKNMSIRGIRAKMGLPPHLGIGSVKRRAVAKEWKSEQSKERELKFLRKRKRLGKKDSLPSLPDRGIEASETRTANVPTKVVRNNVTGDLQISTIRSRNQLLRYKNPEPDSFPRT